MNTLSLCRRVIRENVCTKVMATKRDVIAASTTNVRMDNGKKDRKGKKHQKCNEVILLDPTPCEALTFHPLLTIEANDDKFGHRCHRRRGKGYMD